MQGRRRQRPRAALSPSRLPTSRKMTLTRHGLQPYRPPPAYSGLAATSPLTYPRPPGIRSGVNSFPPYVSRPTGRPNHMAEPSRIDDPGRPPCVSCRLRPPDVLEPRKCHRAGRGWIPDSSSPAEHLAGRMDPGRRRPLAGSTVTATSSLFGTTGRQRDPHRTCGAHQHPNWSCAVAQAPNHNHGGEMDPKLLASLNAAPGHGETRRAIGARKAKVWPSSPYRRTIGLMTNAMSGTTGADFVLKAMADCLTPWRKRPGCRALPSHQAGLSGPTQELACGQESTRPPA
jgi:hypothetical protein